MSQLAVVVVAYNRLPSLKRLVGALYKANYLGDKVDLIISLDNSGSDLLLDYAKSLNWPHGELKIIAHNERLGLKRHVLKCGQLTDFYDNICVLEDDLYVSPSFYAFAKSASIHFKDIKDIAGISLYSYQWNQYANRPFDSIEDRFDVFLLQVASSWGQVWSREGWSDFMAWMRDKTDDDLHSHLLPTAVSNWSDKSWLKFHNKYLVDSGKYFVYPRRSLTTNFSDQGEHATLPTTTYQVPLILDTKINYEFPSDIGPLVKYDAFFENKNIASCLGIPDFDLDVDLFGTRVHKKRYVLTTEILDFKVLRSFGLKLRPVDANVLLGIAGDGIYLYDTSMPLKNDACRRSARNARFFYEVKFSEKKEFLLAATSLYKKAIMRRLKII